MKIDFDDKSYIEIKNAEDGKILVMLYAKDSANPLKGVINTCELTRAQFVELCTEVIADLMISQSST